MWTPFLGSSSRIHTSSIGSKELIVAGCCALVLLVVLIFDSGLSSPGLICCYAMSLRYVDFMSCGYTPAVCFATGIVNLYTVVSSPASTGSAEFLRVLLYHMVQNLRYGDTPAGSRLVRSSIGTKVWCELYLSC